MFKLNDSDGNGSMNNDIKLKLKISDTYNNK